MNKLLERIIEESFEQVNAGKLLSLALKKQPLTGNFYMISIGKAACVMAQTAFEHFGDRITEGIIITPYGSSFPVGNFPIIEAAHPYPDNNSLLAGRKLIELAEKLHRKDQILLLISGGTSSLVEVPRDNLPIEEIAEINQQLQYTGIDIIELNTVRKHLSLIKGGQFARLVDPANIYSFLLSDVPGDRTDTIGSGLASPDLTTSQAALDILQRSGLDISDRVIEALKEETPAKLRNVRETIIGNNELLCQITAEVILQKGYIPWLLTTDMEGEARNYAHMIPDIVKSARSSKSRISLPCIAICGGETTVRVVGNGKGGRNQELALAAAIAIRNLKGVTIAAVASDGIDGNSEFAGAIIDNCSYDRMLSCGVNPEASLHNNDSSSALNRIDAVIATAKNVTNLNDLLLILIDKA